MSAYKNISLSGISTEKSIAHYTQNLDTGSEGLVSTRYVSGSINNNYWNSIHILYYTSGSPILNEFTYTGYDKFDNSSYNFSNYGLSSNNQYVNKFHGYPSGSIVSIAQPYFGDKIKPNTFELKDPNYKDNDGITLEIKDDGNGNLYSTNAHFSQSGATSISSSENYVGNIFYDMGVAIITETGSWSGSVNYSDVTSKGDYEVQFKSTNTIFTNEYTIQINPQEFNYSTNYTLRCFLKDSGLSMPENSASILSNPYLCSDYTGSEFQPYITTIGLYTSDNIHDPVIVARLPKALRVSNKVTTTIKLRLDM